MVVVVALMFPVLVCWDCTMTVLFEPSTTTLRLLPMADAELLEPPAPLKLSDAPLNREVAPAKCRQQLLRAPHDLADGVSGRQRNDALLEIDDDERGVGVKNGECHRSTFRPGDFRVRRCA